MTNLYFEQAATVGFEVAVVDFTHGVYILISDLLGHSSLIGQKKLVEESAKKVYRNHQYVLPTQTNRTY